MINTREIPLSYIHLILRIQEQDNEALVPTEGDDAFEKYSIRKSYIQKEWLHIQAESVCWFKTCKVNLFYFEFETALLKLLTEADVL